MTARIRTEIITVRPEFPGAAVTELGSFTTDQLTELTPAVIAKLFLDPPLPDRLPRRPGENPDDAQAREWKDRRRTLDQLPADLKLKVVANIYELRSRQEADPEQKPKGATTRELTAGRRESLILAEEAVQTALAPKTLTALTVRKDPLPLQQAIVDVPDGEARKDVFAGVLNACLNERQRRLNQLELQAQTGAIAASALEQGKQQADGVLAQGVNTLAGIDGAALTYFRPTFKRLARRHPEQAALVVRALKPRTVLNLGPEALEWATPEQLAAAARSNMAGALPHILEAVTAMDGDACTPNQKGFGLLEEVTRRLAAGPNAAGIAKRIRNLAERGDDAAIEAASVLGLRFDQD